MSGSLNKVMLIGNLGRDPEVRTFSNGGRVCHMNVATTETWRDRETGERRDRTEWHRVSVFGDGLIQNCEQYLRKGSKIYVEGQLQTRKFQDPSTGADRYATDVVVRGFGGTITFLDSRSGGAGGGSPDAGGGYRSGGIASGPSSERSQFGNDDLDDEIPF
ncbi:MAG: single-stranded DNA-binding protein [Paracoccaceae bacterium]|nr:single-stranded DNA-binding protein [Paracoccaceae bacterium]MDE2915221.1 single-stranded DNA-binding protein [Paracoccaceae bacterium]